MSVESPEVENLRKMFEAMDSDNDGHLSLQDYTSSEFAATFFENAWQIKQAFSVLNNKMNFDNFKVLGLGHKMNMLDAALFKIEISKNIGKYLNVSSPGQACPGVKQSYLRFVADKENKNSEEKMHLITFEAGIDRIHQEQKFQAVTTALGKKPHEVFFLIKIKVLQNGPMIAQKFQTLANDMMELLVGLAPQMEKIMNCFKVEVRYSEGYLYFIVEVDSQFLDIIIKYFNELIQTVSPDCNFKFKANITSDVSHLLLETFNYEESHGSVTLELDFDHMTMKKVKEIVADNQGQHGFITPPVVLVPLLLEEVKIEATFKNLGEALMSAANVKLSQIPKPYDFLHMIKEFSIKQTLESLHEGAPEILNLINENCEGEGQISFNLRDMFIKLSFDLHIHNAFDLIL